MTLLLKHEYSVRYTGEMITLICVVRDERILLDYFIQHYLNIGVTHFIFIDNGSVDDTMEYLSGRNDINCRVYYTEDSYAENEFGVAWVNKILDTNCLDKWCVVVDVDELLIPPGGEKLSGISSKLESSGSNVLPTCLIDFYPKRFDRERYITGMSFFTHSNHYDKYVKDDLLIYSGNGGEVVVKGGVRHRVFGENREPVCLTKKSFFKYNFYKTHKLSVGMHWLLPLDFDHTEPGAWSAYTKWSEMNRHIKFWPGIYGVAHFKFIKPDVYSFFKKRVDRNQDWDNSTEYKTYIKHQPESLFKSGVSEEFSTVNDVYRNLIKYLVP